MIVTIVMVINPYGVSPLKLSFENINDLKTQRINNDRLIKPLDVWLMQPKTVFLGTSRIQQSINPQRLRNTELWPAYNASVPAAELSENLQFIELYLRIAPSITDVYMEAYFYNFARSVDENLPSLSMLDFVSERMSLYFSGSALVASAKTVLASASPNRHEETRPLYIDPFGHRVQTPSFAANGMDWQASYTEAILSTHTTYRKLDVAPSATRTLERIKQLCDLHRVNLHLVIAPNYIWDDYRLITLGYEQDLRDFLTAISVYPNTWSFAQATEVSVEPAAEHMKWWYDTIHFSTETGDLMLDAIHNQGETPITDLALRVEPNNADSIVDQRISATLEWARQEEFAEYFEYIRLRDYPDSGHPDRDERVTHATVEKIQEKATHRLDSETAAKIESEKLLASAIVEPNRIVIGGREYLTHSGPAGSVETATFRGAKLHLSGWAADFERKARVQSVLVVSSSQVMAKTETNISRSDIAISIAPGVAQTGFSITIDDDRMKLAGTSPIRLYALTADGRAVRLAAPALAGSTGSTLEAFAFQ